MPTTRGFIKLLLAKFVGLFDVVLRALGRRRFILGVGHVALPSGAVDTQCPLVS